MVAVSSSGLAAGGEGADRCEGALLDHVEDGCAVSPVQVQSLVVVDPSPFRATRFVRGPGFEIPESHIGADCP